jgi:hypothetical protein
MNKFERDCKDFIENSGYTFSEEAINDMTQSAKAADLWNNPVYREELKLKMIAKLLNYKEDGQRD